VDGDPQIIVKAMKCGRYCFNTTDTHYRHELHRVDIISVARITFPEKIKAFQPQLAQVPDVQTNGKLRMDDHRDITSLRIENKSRNHTHTNESNPSTRV
jgi:hypothetical protein